MRGASAERGGARQGLELCSVINAFTVPKISYDPVGRKLYANNEPRSIFAPANAKSKLYLDRLHLIAQRVRRSTLFQAQTFHGGAHGPHLTDIQSLKGAALGSRRFVLGCISRSEDGRYVLEDASGSVPLDLSKALTASGFYTENCIVIAEGEMNVDGAFYALAMGLPPTELRENLPMAAQVRPASHFIHTRRQLSPSSSCLALAE
jgi:DNA polymerase epsilon subunit 2